MNNGKGGSNRRRSGKRRDQNAAEWQEERKKPEKFRFDKSRGVILDRPKWTPIKIPSGPLPTAVCAICKNVIKDIASAVSDKFTGDPAHFDCVLLQIKERERLEPGDEIAYIGGGRFGVIRQGNSHGTRRFQIKRILEWEDKENRADWRKSVTDRYSLL